MYLNTKSNLNDYSNDKIKWPYTVSVVNTHIQQIYSTELLDDHSFAFSEFDACCWLQINGAEMLLHTWAVLYILGILFWSRIFYLFQFRFLYGMTVSHYYGFEFSVQKKCIWKASSFKQITLSSWSGWSIIMKDCHWNTHQTM